MIARRNFLRALPALGMPAIFLRSMSAEAASAGNRILVAIQMVGGNDGLNSVIPLTQYGSYAALRMPATPPDGLALAYTQSALAPLAFNANPAVAAGQATQFAFAPSMQAMRTLYATGKLAVVAGVGLPAAEANALSHYNAQMDWLTGQINIDGAVPAGWMGLALNGGGGTLGPAASLAGSNGLIATSATQGLVLSSPIDDYGLFYANSDNYYGLVKAFGATQAMPVVQAGQPEQASMQASLASVQSVGAIAKAVPAQDYPTPATPLDFQLRDIARLIIGGAGLLGYVAVQEGYDTHANQALYQPALIGQLSTSMANFYAYLQANGVSSNVLIMTMTDFGRRPAANMDFGTDHGGAGVSFVLGDAVTGGVFGTYPSLTALDANQNLAMNVDFRNVISDLIQAMGGNPSQILGTTYPKLGFI